MRTHMWTPEDKLGYRFSNSVYFFVLFGDLTGPELVKETRLTLSHPRVSASLDLELQALTTMPGFFMGIKLGSLLQAHRRLSHLPMCAPVATSVLPVLSRGRLECGFTSPLTLVPVSPSVPPSPRS